MRYPKRKTPIHNFTFTFGSRDEAYETFATLSRILGHSRLAWGCNNRPLRSTQEAVLAGKKAKVAFYINTNELTLDKLVQLCSNTTIISIEAST